jgi:hypothetical protein
MTGNVTLQTFEYHFVYCLMPLQHALRPLVLHLHAMANGKDAEGTNVVSEPVQKLANESYFQIMVKSSDGDNCYNEYVMAVLKTIKAIEMTISMLSSRPSSIQPRDTSDHAQLPKAMPNRLSHDSMSLNARIPWFEASELKGFMDVECIFDGRTDGSQLKDGVALQIFRLETLAMLFGECCSTAALFFVPCVNWRAGWQAINVRRCQRV